MRTQGVVNAALVVLLACGSAACSGGVTEISCAHKPTRTTDGVIVLDSSCGQGEGVGRGDLVEVRFTGSVRGDDPFESHADPYRFKVGVGEVIDGWDQGMLGMQVGGTRRLTIPPDLAYGSFGLPPHIPPNATLVYDIDLLSRRAPD